MSITETDLTHLHRCVALAADALDAGDEPFGSILVNGAGKAIFEDRNRVSGGDRTRHPEFEIARWASAHLTPEERAAATVYTSGEHCPMCAAAHGWAGLGRIVYATSSAQLATWLREWDLAPAPVAPLPITEVLPGAHVDGPVPELADPVRSLQRALHFRPAQPADEPSSVGAFDLERYLGLWYEIGRLPLRFEDVDASEVTAHYSLNDDGSIRVVNRCLDDEGAPSEAIGQAEPDAEHPGRLSVSFLPTGLRWIPFTRADYWVLRIDSEYRTALVGTPDRRHLWLLSREPELDPRIEESLLVEAAREGYDLRDWIRPVQSGAGAAA